MSGSESSGKNARNQYSIRDEFYIERVRDEAIIQLKTVSGKTAADIGAGTGFMSEGLLDAELNVIAVDSSPAMIEFLREKFADIKEFRAALTDSSSITLADDSADYAFANMYLHHMDDPQSAVKEIFRILKPGGKAAITDLLFHNHEDLLKTHQNRWPGFTFPDLYDWFINAEFKNISIEKLNPLSIDGSDIKFEIFIACGEK